MALKQLRAGAGCAAIQFSPEMFPTDGIYGVHDAPHARVLVLEAGEKAAIVVFEMVNGDSFVELAKDIVSEICDVPRDHVWVHVTHAITTPHTPGGPSAVPGEIRSGPGGPGGPGPKHDPDGPKKRELFLAAIEASARTAAQQAADGMRDAVYGVGTGDCDVACNRDVETPFGWWTGLNPEGKTNKKMTILAVKALDGTPIGYFMSYGIKPCAIDNSDMGKPSRLTSTDVPGLACTMMEERFGAPCLFAMAAAGDQVPRGQIYVDVVDEEGKVGHSDLGYAKGLEVVEQLGKEMGEVAIRIAEGINCRQAEADVAVVSDNVLLDLKGSTGRRSAPVKSMECKADGQILLAAEGIRLGQDFAFVAVKPETNCQTERELWEQSPFEHTVLLSMTNGGMKYMPDQEAYDKATWEAGSSMLMPGSAEKWRQRAVDMLKALKEGVREPEITAVVEPRPDGARITKAVIEFFGEIPDVNALEVVGRNITAREVQGSTVTLYLDEEDQTAKIIPKHEPGGPRPGGPGGPGGSGGPGGRPPRPETKVRVAAVEVKIPGFAAPVASTKAEQGVIDEFVPGTYRRILYNLYTPKGYDPAEKYPLVVFIPDAGANGNKSVISLYQGIGATIWAEPEEQEKHPCFVLAVQIPSGIILTNNEHKASDELEDIVSLIHETMEKYSIDDSRVYATGQSQGCMATGEINIRYPDLLAASMLVAGHWDVEKMVALTDAKFFFGLSEGGLGEFPNFNAITEGREAKGVKTGRVRLNFRDGWEINNAKVREAAEGVQDVYVIFDKATAFPDDGKVRHDGAHHGRGWELTYQLEPARDWLFAQRK